MDTIFVKQVKEGGPAHGAGLCTGNNQSLNNYSLSVTKPMRDWFRAVRIRKSRFLHPRHNVVNYVIQSRKLPPSQCNDVLQAKGGKKTASGAVFSSGQAMEFLGMYSCCAPSVGRYPSDFYVYVETWNLQHSYCKLQHQVTHAFLKQKAYSLYTPLLLTSWSLLLIPIRWSTSEGEWSKHHRESLLWGYIPDPRQVGFNIN